MKRALAALVAPLWLASCAMPDAHRPPPVADVKAAYTDKEISYPVLYGTSRMPNRARTGFLDERAARVHYGRAIVTIPKGRLTGSLGEKGLFSSRDTRLAIAQGQIEFHSQDGFMALAKSQLGVAATAENSYVLVFISFIPEDFPSHTYVASTLPLLTDVKNLLVNGKPARQGAAWKAHPTYWTVGPTRPLVRSSCGALSG